MWNGTSCVLICISLMTNDSEHLFMCLFTVLIFSLMKCIFKSFAHLKKKIGVFYYWVLRPYSICWIQVLYELCDLQIFSPGSGFFVFFSKSFENRCSCFAEVQIISFSKKEKYHVFDGIYKKLLSNSRSQRFFSYVSF